MWAEPLMNILYHHYTRTMRSTENFSRQGHFSPSLSISHAWEVVRSNYCGNLQSREGPVVGRTGPPGTTESGGGILSDNRYCSSGEKYSSEFWTRQWHIYCLIPSQGIQFGKNKITRADREVQSCSHSIGQLNTEDQVLAVATKSRISAPLILIPLQCSQEMCKRFWEQLF